MRTLPAGFVTALSKKAIQPRDFIYVTARNRTTGLSESVGLWSDYGDFTAEVINPETGATVSRDFYGFFGLVAISDIQMTSQIQVQQVTVTLSQISDLVDQIFRTYDAKQAKIEVYTGLLDMNTKLMVAPAVCRFFGFVNDADVETPSENEEGWVKFICTSHTQEMTRSNPQTRSHEDQKLRNASDTFFKDASVVTEWEVFWGLKSGKMVTLRKTNQASAGGGKKSTSSVKGSGKGSSLNKGGTR